jgi:hypothetical protein
MNNRVVCELIVGCAMGIALGAAVLYGLVELADWIVETTNALR